MGLLWFVLDNFDGLGGVRLGLFDCIMKSYILPLAGMLGFWEVIRKMIDDFFYDATWDIHTAVGTLEKELLCNRYVQRLKYLNHRGVAYVNSNHTFSRYEHTLGVLALVAHFDKDNLPLRAAAILHDVGHLPFSHTLEPVLNIDHHDRTIAIVTSPEISNILAAHNIEASLVLELIGGEAGANILRNDLGFSHCDHLDSWVRGAVRNGWGPALPSTILSNCFVEDGLLTFNEEGAIAVADTIFHEAELHFAPQNLAAQAILRDCVRRYVGNNTDLQKQIAELTDFELISWLSAADELSELMNVLFFEAFSLHATLVEQENISPVAEIAMNKIYGNQPKIVGDQELFYSRTMADRMETLKLRTGVYQVYIRKLIGAA